MNTDRLALGIILVLHLIATCRFFPPTEVFLSEPLQFGDHPIHTYRVYMYREGLRESGLPWGYDPAISAGTVMNPAQDLGSKPQQVLGALLPFIPPGTVVRLFLFLALLSSPLWLILACRRLGIPAAYHSWILFVFIASLWLLQEGAGYWHAGLVSFAVSAFFSIFVLAIFLNFLSKPNTLSYLSLVITATISFFLHILGLIVIFPVLVFYTLSTRSISWSWRFLLIATPLFVLLLNAFWFIPYLSAQNIPWPEGMVPRYPPDDFGHLQFVEFSDLLTLFANPRRTVPLLLRLLLAVYGVLVLNKMIGRRASFAVGATCLCALFLTYFGSFIPIIARMQPVRFEVHLMAFLTIPAGTALAALAAKYRLPISTSAATMAVVLAVVVAIFRPRPHPLDLPSSSDPLAAFISTHTDPDHRLLIQSRDGYKGGWYETKIFPLWLGKEVIGSNFQLIYDPPQFLRTMLLGREIREWQPEELYEALIRWGISWVFTVTPDALELMESTLGPPETSAGDYSVFRVPESPTRFLVGSGIIEPHVNRMELSELDPKDGLIILRYRYNPSWHTTSGLPVHQYSIPEDPTGFIALKDPPPSVTLHFDPWRMLKAPWPDKESRLSLP